MQVCKTAKARRGTQLLDCQSGYSCCSYSSPAEGTHVTRMTLIKHPELLMCRVVLPIPSHDWQLEINKLDQSTEHGKRMAAVLQVHAVGGAY
jgi:hypothetical protein